MLETRASPNGLPGRLGKEQAQPMLSLVYMWKRDIKLGGPTRLDSLAVSVQSHHPPGVGGDPDLASGEGEVSIVTSFYVAS